MKVVGVVGEGLGELSLGEGLGTATLDAGGDAANICVMAARAGAKARLLGRVGTDGVGERLSAFWAGCGIDLTHLKRDPDACTGLYLNETGAGASHRFAYWRAQSAGSRLAEEDLQGSFLEGLGVLVVTGITLAVSASSSATALRSVEEARRRDIPVACVVNHRPALGGDEAANAGLAESCEIVIASDADLAGLYGDMDIARSRLIHGAEDRELVITGGARGAELIVGEAGWEQAAPLREVRNAAGAGDAVAGTYLAARVAGLAPPTALRLGVAAASISVSREGCATSYPHRDEVEAAARELPALAPSPQVPAEAR